MRSDTRCSAHYSIEFPASNRPDEPLFPMTDIEARVVLNGLPKIGPIRVRQLIERFGDAPSILRQPVEKLAGGGLPQEAVRSLAEWRSLVDPEAELARAAAFGAEVVVPDDPRFPRMLREIHDPPLLLYLWGTLLPTDHHAIAVVGPRKPSTYGSECAKKLTYQLANAGLVVVSGLARGVDTLAHQAALAAGQRTIAVLGGGLGRLYPPENAGLAEKIAGQGAVLSEFPLDRDPDRQTFPIRNRLVAGWSQGLLVIEASRTSGAMITANFAAEQGRTVFAVPGPINRTTSTGTNSLIQQGARLVTSAQDVLDEYQLLLPPEPAKKPGLPPPSLPEREALLFTLTGESDEVTFDFLVDKSGLPPHQVSAGLLVLEMKKLVKPLPGQRFVKL